MQNSAKDPKVKLLRNLSYVFITIFVAIGTFLLVRYAEGFEIDPATGKFTQNGLVLIESEPVDADISVDDRPVSDQTPDRQILPVGQHTIKLTAEGYRPWSKTFEIVGSDLIWLNYPLLIPETIETEPVSVFDTSPITAQSANKRYLVVSEAEAKSFTIFDTNNEPVREETLELSPQIKRVILGMSLENIEFAPGSNRFMLAEYSSDSRKEFVVIDRNKTTDPVAINQKYDSSFNEVVFDSRENGRVMYGLETQKLSRFNIDSSNPVSPVIDKVQAVTSKGENTVIVRKVGSEFNFSYLDSSQEVSIIEKTTSRPRLIDTNTHEDMRVAVLAVSGKTYVYKNFAKSAQPRPKTVKITAENIDFGPNGRMLTISNNKNNVTHDLEFNNTYRFMLPDQKDGKLTMIDGFHLSFVDDDSLQIADYDGHNIQGIVPINTRLQPLFDSKSEAIYSFNMRGNNFILRRSSLIVDN